MTGSDPDFKCYGVEPEDSHEYRLLVCDALEENIAGLVDDLTVLKTGVLGRTPTIEYETGHKDFEDVLVQLADVASITSAQYNHDYIPAERVAFAVHTPTEGIDACVRWHLEEQVATAFTEHEIDETEFVDWVTSSITVGATVDTDHPATANGGG